MFRLDGKVALITGSTRGLGWAMAQAMTGAGAHVVVNGRDEDRVIARAGELTLAGGRASGLAFDVADQNASTAAIETIVGRQGGIDILVNNAGVNHRAALADFTPDDWARVLRTNLDAPFVLARAVAPHMQVSGWGRIINTASIMGTVARPTIPAYVASKGGIDALTKALAVELAPFGITVNAIGPGYVATEMNTALVEDPDFNDMVCSRTPLGRWGEPTEIAAAAVFLASAEASYVTGQKLIVDGGMTAAL